MKQKKVLTAMLVSAFAVCLTLGITACGDKKDKEPEPTPVETTYTVTFSLGEGVTGTAPASQTVKSGAKATKPDPNPTRTDFEFNGWYNGTVEWDFAENTVNSDITLTAHWREYFDVTFDLGDGTGAEGADYSAKQVLDGDTITLPAAPTTSVEGKEFTAWKIGDGNTYGDPEDQVTITGDTAITATYGAVQVTVTYYDYDGTVFKRDTLDYGSAYTITTDRPDEKYTKFTAWDATDIESVKADTFIHGTWKYTASDDKYFTFTETDGGDAYTVAEAETPDSLGGGTLYLPIAHDGKPVIGITAGTSNDTAAFATIDATTVIIPDAYTEVAAYAFANNATITTVKYEATEGTLFETNELTKIGSHAFYYTAALASVFTDAEKTINIPNSVTEIADYAFAFEGSENSIDNAQNSSGKDLLSPVRALTFEGDSTLTKIGKNAFQYAGFGFEKDANGNFSGFELTVPASVVTIEERAFYGARFIYKLDFEADSRCTTIGKESFTANNNTSSNRVGYLADIFIPKSVTSIGDYAFIRQRIKSFVFEKGGTEDLVIGTQIAQQAGNDTPEMTSIEFPARLKAMGTSGQVFSNFDNLKTITFENTEENPSRLTAICNNCFADNAALTTVNIPKSVTTIGASAFSGTLALTTVAFESGGAALTIEDNAFSYGTNTSNGKPTERGYNLLTSFEFPYRTTYIGKNVFKNRNLLSSITFEATPVGKSPLPLTFADFAFGASESAISSSKVFSPLAITQITVPARTEAIGQGFVQGALSLTEIKFEAGFHADIPNYFAYVCPALTKIEIPEGVEKIGSYAFSAGTCSSGKYYNITGSNDEGNVKATSTNLAYADLANDEITTLTIPASVTEIGQYAFRNLINLTTLTFADAAAGKAAALEIGQNNFDFVSGKGTAALTVTIGSSVKSIAAKFCKDSNLKSVIIHEGLETIGNATAEGIFCTTVADAEFSEITLPASLTSIESKTPIFDAPKFATFKVADAANATYESKAEDNGILYKKAPAAGGNRTLAIVPVGNKTEQFSFENVNIGANAFYGNKSITTVTIGENVDLGYQAFMNCTALTTLTISAQPTYSSLGTDIGHVFRACTALDTISTTGLTAVCPYMFYGCTSIATFDALEDITDFGGTTGYAFFGCTHLAWNKEGDADGLTIDGQKATLAPYTFQNCAALTKVTLKNVTEIPQRFFNGCTSLAEIAGIENLTKINQYAFQKTAISSVTLNENVEFLNGNQFNGCKSLKEITLPAGMENIPAAAFSGSGLVTVTLLGTTVKTLGDVSAFPVSNPGFKVIVPDDLVAGYRAASTWSGATIVDKIVGTSTVTISFAQGTLPERVTLNGALPEQVTLHKYEKYTLPAFAVNGLNTETHYLVWKVGDNYYEAGVAIEPEATITIQATALQYATVTFSWGDGVTGVTGKLPDAITKVKWGLITDPNILPEREGFTFLGWKKKGDADTKIWDFTKDVVTGDTELVAVWQADAAE